MWTVRRMDAAPRDGLGNMADMGEGVRHDPNGDVWLYEDPSGMAVAFDHGGRFDCTLTLSAERERVEPLVAQALIERALCEPPSFIPTDEHPDGYAATVPVMDDLTLTPRLIRAFALARLAPAFTARLEARTSALRARRRAKVRDADELLADALAFQQRLYDADVFRSGACPMSERRWQSMMERLDRAVGLHRSKTERRHISRDAIGQTAMVWMALFSGLQAMPDVFALEPLAWLVRSFARHAPFWTFGHTATLVIALGFVISAVIWTDPRGN